MFLPETNDEDVCSLPFLFCLFGRVFSFLFEREQVESARENRLQSGRLQKEAAKKEVQ